MTSPNIETPKARRRREIRELACHLAGKGTNVPEDYMEDATRLQLEYEREHPEEYPQEYREALGVTQPSSPSSSSSVLVEGEGQWNALSLDHLHYLVGGDGDGSQILAPGPGHSPSDRSMCVKPSTHTIDGFVVHSFGRTSDMECKQYVNFLHEYWLYQQLKDDPNTQISSPITPHIPLSWIEATQRIGSHSNETPSSREVVDRDEKIKSAKRQFNKSSRIPGESVYRYFRSRGLELPGDLIGRVVRYQSSGRWYESGGDQIDEKIGLRYSISEIMLFACRDVLTDEGRAIQVVRLPHVGKGPQRKVKGAVANTAIKLTKHQDVIAAGELAVAEGFESALAAMALGYENVWACVSSGNVEIFPVIEGVRKLTILGENCDANKKAREICALRWHEARREVVIAMPEHGKDFNDELVELVLRKAGVA